MNQIRKTKIQNIGRTSRALLWLITPCTVFMYFMIIFFVLFFCFVPSGALSSTDLIFAILDQEEGFFRLIENKGLLISARAFIITIFLYLFIPCIFLLKHLKQVLLCFYRGDIFNTTALMHARKAYAINLFIVFSGIALHLIGILTVLSIKGRFEIDYLTDWASESANGLIEVAISTLLIWAFELGTDVNAEAELTI